MYRFLNYIIILFLIENYSQERDDSSFKFWNPLSFLHECCNFTQNYQQLPSSFSQQNHLQSKLNPLRHQLVLRIFDLLKTKVKSSSKLFSTFAGFELDYHRQRLKCCSSKESKRKCSKKAKMAAKVLLQKQPTNIGLWLKFAQVELESGKIDDYRKVVLNVIKVKH